MATLTQGLQAALRDVPLHRGYVQLGGAWTPNGGPLGRLEAGLHPYERLGVFAFGQLDTTGPSAGVGARLEFNL
jgi:hypothetical protein